MAAINLGPNGLPVQLTPLLPQTLPTALLQAPAAQPPTAIPATERQAGSNTDRSDVTRRDGPPPSKGRGRLVDIRA